MTVEREIWTAGRYNGIVCITATLYPSGSIIATAEPDKITEKKMRKALNEEFPSYDFKPLPNSGDCLCLQGERWTQ